MLNFTDCLPGIELSEADSLSCLGFHYSGEIDPANDGRLRLENMRLSICYGKVDTCILFVLLLLL